MSRFAFPFLIVLLGLGWLLDSLGVIPDVSMIWVLGLAGMGVLILATSGITRESIVIGPFFLAAAVTSTLRQLGSIQLEVELPILIIVLGVLIGLGAAKFGTTGSKGGTTPVN